MHPDEKIYFKNKYRIPSSRLDGWNYANEGYYFITICTSDKKLYFGDIKNEKMNLFDIGEIVKKYWLEIPSHFSNINLDEFVVMPNHVHGIIILKHEIMNVETRFIASKERGASSIRRDESRLYAPSIGGITGGKNPMFKNGLARIIRWYKGRTTYEINKINKNQLKLWQPRYYDHIIKDEEELNGIRQYIIDNTLKWDIDRNNPKNVV
jgi:putative transposase